MESSSLHNDPSLFPTKIFARKTYHHRQHQHQHQKHHRQEATRLPNISRQSSCGGGSIVLPPYVQLDMVHAATGGVFLNHFLSSNNNNNNINNQFPISSSLPPILPSHHHYYHQQQPPLLPLPAVSKPTFYSLPALTRRTSLSSSIPRKQPNQKVIKSPATPRNNKRTTTDTHHKNIINKKGNSSNSVGSKGVGPDPVIDPEDVTRVQVMGAQSVFCVSPPPSSLPLPKFSLRQGCKAEAAVDEVDSGAATDNLCRLLKLR